MELTADNKLRNLIIIGDRVLIRPKKQAEKTASGLYLPPGIQEKEKVQSGYIIEDDEPWKDNDEKIKYVPLQVEEGDLAIFLQRGAIEIMYGNEKLYIVPQSSILMLERDEAL